MKHSLTFRLQSLTKISALIILLMFLAVPKVQFATIVTSNGTGGGPWEANESWIPGKPACGDTIYIQNGDVITVEQHQDYGGCAFPMFLIIQDGGTLDFNTNGPKLSLPCGSGVTIETTGLLTSTAATGGGASNKLNICGSEVWRRSDGDKSNMTFGTPLPIDLISFEANANEDKVDIKWITASEINNDYFTIERSLDGREWSEVIVTGGAGNSSVMIEYFETDFNPLQGVSYYRLKQTDFNGEFSYSNVVPVRFEAAEADFRGTLNLFPNPVKVGEIVKVEFKNIFESELLVVLRDIKGRDYYSKIVIDIEDGALIGIPIDQSIPPGIYLITASSENQMYSQRLIIK